MKCVRYMLIARRCQQNPEFPGSAREKDFRACSPVERHASPESDSEDGETEDEAIEEDFFCNTPSLAPCTSIALPALHSQSMLPPSLISNSLSKSNDHRYTAQASTMTPVAVECSTLSSSGTSAQESVHIFSTSQTISNGTFDSSFGAESVAPMQVNWASYGAPGTATSGYDSFGAPVSGPAHPPPADVQDFMQIMGLEAPAPMRATLTLEATSSALSGVVETLLKTNTRFTIETNQ
jgi:hypothetical protein